MSDYLKGLLIVGAGVLIISPDAALIRLIDMDPWSLAMWRSLAAGLMLLVLSALRHRGGLVAHIRSYWPIGLYLLPLVAVGQVGFVAGVTQTSPAIVLVLVGATPFFTAVAAWLIVGERSGKATMIAISIGFIGVSLTILGGEGAEITLIGNLWAISVPISLAIIFALMRRLTLPDPWFMFGISQVIVCLTIYLFLPTELPPTTKDWALILTDGALVSAFAMAFITLGLKYLPAAEVSLIMTGETILGPILVWLFVGLTPSPWMWVGGCLVLAALVGNALWRMREQKPETNSA